MLRSRSCLIAVCSLFALACGGLELPLPDEEAVVIEALEAHPAEPAIATSSKQVVLDDRIDLVLHDGRGDDGPIVLQFSDWRCPHCYQAMPTIREAAEQHGAQLRFRSFPLAGPCNPMIEREDPDRCELALAAVCAHQNGTFDDFAARAERDDGLVRTLSRDGAFAACLEAPDTASIVREQAQSGADLELVGTPTFFVRVDGTWFEPRSPDEVVDLLKR